MEQVSGDRGNPFGTRLRRAREAAGLSQDELAERAGLSPNTVGGLERGEHHRPYPATIRALADALGLTEAERAALTASMTLPDPAATPVDVRSSRLPALLTPLLGREREMEIVSTQLQGNEVRLITLTGPGGVGKTALALQVASNLSAVYGDGAAFVPLAAVRDANLVASAIAQSLGLAEAGRRSLPDRLGDALRERHLLLVLDNFEHLLDAAPLVTDLLSQCPRLAILATSRAPLRLAGEHVLPVLPLAVPDPDRLPTTEELAHIAAVRLFVDRAQAINPAFAFSAENAGAVVAICHRLDGLPLAIELAAARAALTAPEAMLPRLARRLPLLTGGRRDAPSRHQTMRDAIGWSHDLLTPEEQTLFRQLAVFVGGCTVDAAEWMMDGVSSQTFPNDRSPLDLVACLVEASLLRQESTPPGQLRYAMLETVREYGLEQLAISGQEGETRLRHASWFLTLAEEAELAVMGPDSAWWLDRLEIEHPNLRTAFDWMDEHGDAESSVRLAAALWRFWWQRGHLNEGRRRLGHVLGHAGVSDGARAKALRGFAELERTGGAPPRAVDALYAESAGLARACGDRQTEGYALLGWGVSLLNQGDFATAEGHLLKSLALARSRGDDVSTAISLDNLASIACYRQEHAHAAMLAEEALLIQRSAAQDSWGTAFSLSILATIGLETGAYQSAARLAGDAMVIAQRLRVRWLVAACVLQIARALAACGRPAHAARLLGAEAAMLAAIGEPTGTAAENRGERTAGAIRGTVEQAAYERVVAEVRSALDDATFHEAWIAGAALSQEDAVAEALNAAAEIADGVESPAHTGAVPVHGLTTREVEVLRLLIERRSNVEIAAMLFIGRRTVETHVANILAKLGTPTRAAAAAHAVQHRIV